MSQLAKEKKIDLYAQLVESKERFDLLARNLPGILYLCNNDETFSMIFLNEQVKKITGFSVEEFMDGRIDFVQLYHPEDKERIFAKVEKALDSKESFHLNYRIHTKSGKWIWVEEHGQGIYHGNKLKYIEGVLIDNTELKETQLELDNYVENLEQIVKDRTEELKVKNEELSKNVYALQETLNQLEETQSHLVKSEKLASLGLLVAGIGHELNNPLNYIKNGSTALKQKLKHKDSKIEDIDNLLAAVEEGADRCADIVNSLRQFARQVDATDESCSIHDIIDNCLKILNNKIKDKMRVECKFEASSDLIVGNAGRLHQAFLNILNNAEQSMPEGGLLSIETVRDGSLLIVKISDTGSGISKENLNKVLDPFFTTKAPGEGTGLGLSITHTIFEEHKAEVTIYSKINEGTTFEIKFANE